MSFQLKLNSLSQEKRREILTKFTVTQKKTAFNENNQIKYRCFLANKETNSLRLPLGVWGEYCESFPNGTSKDFLKMNRDAKFAKKLLTPETDPQERGRDQTTVVKEALKQLKTTGSTFLSCYTGMGKTCMAIYLSIKLGLKTIILCHLDSIRKQWPDEYDVFSDGTIRIQFLEGANVKLDKFADVYIVGIQKCANLDHKLFKDIGTVIVDEAHIATVTAFTDVLFKFTPRYLIGLSATFDRRDGLHSMLSFYFGDPNNFIIRKEQKNFTVYKYQTKYKPEIGYIQRYGKTTLNWNLVVESIESEVDRWIEIADICANHPKENIIILCNRTVLSKGVYNILLERKESVELFIGNAKTYNKDARIVIVGCKKGGVGLNNPKLTMGIITFDTQDVRQYEGRIRVANNIIYHFVDNHPTLENHWKPCEEWYSEKGAKIIPVGVSHPKFPVQIKKKDVAVDEKDETVVVDDKLSQKLGIPSQRFLKKGV